MPFNLPSLSQWDFILILAVSLQTLILAYRPSPRGKALLLSLPIPFTLAVLAVGLKVGASNMLGLALLFLFTHGVRLLHYQMKMPIVPAIGLSLAGYCVLGWWLSGVLPATPMAFWLSTGGVMAAALALYIALPFRPESTAATPLPIWRKLPMVVAVVCGLVALKGVLQGFATLFPMVGVVAAYEARGCLWTMGRQIPVIMLSMAPMIAAVYLAQDSLGVGYALALGWLVYLAVFTPLSLTRQREGLKKE